MTRVRSGPGVSWPAPSWQGDSRRVGWAAVPDAVPLDLPLLRCLVRLQVRLYTRPDIRIEKNLAA